MKTTIYTDKIKRELIFKLYSDLHYIPNDDLSFFRKSVSGSETNPPDYIFLLGDLIDDSIFTKEELKELLDLLYRLTRISKVIFILGNHEQFTRYNNKSWVDYYNYEFINELRNMDINVLQNEYFIDDDLCVYGMNFNSSYYIEKEPINEFVRGISKINFDDTYFNILCEHSPRHVFNSELMKDINALNNTDLVLSAHYHNGCVPYQISRFIPKNMGFISPYKELFPKNARGEKLITESTYGIISTPIRVFPRYSRFYSLNDILYPPKEQTILIKKKK